MINKEVNSILRQILKDNIIPKANPAINKLLEFKGPTSQLDSKDIFDGKNVMAGVFEVRAEGSRTTDHRITEMSFRHFRSIPVPNSGHYGLKFTNEEGEPISLFLVGCNGAGKTTVFSAFERHYLSDTTLSKEKDLEESKILTYGFGQIKGIDTGVPTLSVKTMSGQYLEEHLDNKESYCSPAPFCSEYDLIQLGKKGEDLSEYILEQLGYGSLKLLCIRLGELIDGKRRDLDLSNDYTQSDLKSPDMDVVIKQVLEVYKDATELMVKSRKYTSLYHQDYANFQKGQMPKIFTRKWEGLKNLSREARDLSPATIAARARRKVDDDTSLKPEDIEKQLQSMYGLLEDALKSCDNNKDSGLLTALDKLFNEKHNMVEKYGRGLFGESFTKKTTEELDILQNIINQIRLKERNIVEQFAKERFAMIQDILEIFSNMEGELYIPSDLPSDKLRFEVKSSKKSENYFHATPQEYYNSFRFKLYAVSFKVALALMEMKLKEIRVPIVIDDVFNASDFENNLRLEQFVYNIYKAYDSLHFEEPLQLILLTHDEMVLNAFRKGADLMIEEKQVKEKLTLPRLYQCGRLFSYKYAKKMAEECGTKPDPNDGEYFYNLYMSI